MKKHTGETILSLIGVILFACLLVGLIGNIPRAAEIEELLPTFMYGESGEGQHSQFSRNGVMYLMVISLIWACAGLIAAMLLKRQNKAAMSGKLLIVTAILSIFSTLGLGIFGSVAYLVAGTRILIRHQTVS